MDSEYILINGIVAEPFRESMSHARPRALRATIRVIAKSVRVREENFGAESKTNGQFF